MTVSVLGDGLMLPNVAVNMTEQEIDRTFGADFSSAVLALTPGEWEGPIESGFGLHLIKVTQVEPSRIPDWNEVRQRIADDVRYEGRKSAEDQFYSEVAPRYQITYDEAASAALEGVAP